MGLVWFGIVGFFYLCEVFLVEFVGLDDLGVFLVMLAIPPQKKKSSANGCGFIERCSVQLLP